MATYMPPSLAPSLAPNVPSPEEQTTAVEYETMVRIDSTVGINERGAPYRHSTKVNSVKEVKPNKIPDAGKASKKKDSSASKKASKGRSVAMDSAVSNNVGVVSSSKKKTNMMFPGKIQASSKMSSAAAEVLSSSDASSTLRHLEQEIDDVSYNTRGRRGRDHHNPLHLGEDVALQSDYGTNETAITAPISDRTFQSSLYADSMNSSLMRSYGSSRRSSKFSSLMGSLRQESLRVLQEGQFGEEDETEEAGFQKWTESIRLLQEETYHPSLKREQPHPSNHSVGVLKKKRGTTSGTGTTCLCDPSLDSFFEIMYGPSDGADSRRNSEEMIWTAIEELLSDSSCSDESYEHDDDNKDDSTLAGSQHIQWQRNWGEEAAEKQPVLLKAISLLSLDDLVTEEKQIEAFYALKNKDDVSTSNAVIRRQKNVANIEDRSIEHAKHALDNVMNVLFSTMDIHHDDKTAGSYQSQASTHVQDFRRTMDTNRFTIHDLFRWSLRRSERSIFLEERHPNNERTPSAPTSDSDECVVLDSSAIKSKARITSGRELIKGGKASEACSQERDTMAKESELPLGECDNDNGKEVLVASISTDSNEKHSNNDKEALQSRKSMQQGAPDLVFPAISNDSLSTKNIDMEHNTAHHSSSIPVSPRQNQFKKGQVSLSSKVATSRLPPLSPTVHVMRVDVKDKGGKGGGPAGHLSFQKEEEFKTKNMDASIISECSTTKNTIVPATGDEMTDISDASFTARLKTSPSSSDGSDSERWLKKGFTNLSDESDLETWAESKYHTKNANSINEKKYSINDKSTTPVGVTERGRVEVSSTQPYSVKGKSEISRTNPKDKISYPQPRISKVTFSPTAMSDEILQDSEGRLSTTRDKRAKNEDDYDDNSSESSDPEIEVRSNVSSMVSSLTNSSFSRSQEGQISFKSKEMETSSSKEVSSMSSEAATVPKTRFVGTMMPVESEDKYENVAAIPVHQSSTDDVDQVNEIDLHNDGPGESKDRIFALSRRISELDPVRERRSEMLDHKEQELAEDPGADQLSPVSYTYEGKQHLIILDTGESREETSSEGITSLTQPKQGRKENNFFQGQDEENICIKRTGFNGDCVQRANTNDQDSDREKKGDGSNHHSSTSKNRYLILAADRKSFRRIQSSRSIRIAEVVSIENQNQVPSEESESSREASLTEPADCEEAEKQSPSVGMSAPALRAKSVTNNKESDESNALEKSTPPGLGPVEKRKYLLFLEDEQFELQGEECGSDGGHLAYDRYDMATVSSLENLFYANYPLGDVIEILPEEANPLPTDEITIDSFVLAKSTRKVVHETQPSIQSSTSQKVEKKSSSKMSFRRGSVGKFADSCLLFVRPAKNLCKVGARKINKKHARKSMTQYDEWSSNSKMK